MARLERGKGKRQQVIEVSQYGRVLRTREDDGGDLRLPGYRRCANAVAARSALEAEVRRLIDDGMKPGDDEARAIAAAMPGAADDTPATLPLRRDLGVYNEANGFVVTPRRMAGKTLEEGSDEWRKAAAKGDLLPMSLVQDDPFVIRIVAGEPLSAQEAEEWVARVDWHLNVSDGKLCVTGGSVFSNEDYDADDPYYEGYVAEVALPKGRYRATLYIHVHGVNGGAVLDLLAGGAYGSGEALDAWWARTRGSEPPPAYDDDTDLVGFLLHLEPIEKAPPKKDLTELPEEGWFDGSENARTPERCPRGLVGVDVVRRQREDNSGWTYVRDVRELVGERKATALRGGPLAIPITDLPFVGRLAWFASRWVVFELGLSGPAELGDITAIDWPEGVVAVDERGAGRLLLDSDVVPIKAVALLADIAQRIAALPSGTQVELLSAALTMSGEPGVEGTMRTSGTVRDGIWSITGVWPAVDAPTLTSALALAREVGSGTSLAAPTDADAIIARARRESSHHLEEDPPKARDGAIVFKKGGFELLITGAAAFAVRFGKTWPVVTTATDDDEDDGADDDGGDDAGDGLFPTSPIKGASVWSAPSGRTYLQTMALLLSEDVASTAQARDRALVARGYTHVGDLVCDADPEVAVRGYAKAGGTVWGFLVCAAPDTVIVRLASLYADGGVLITSGDPEVTERPEARIHRTVIAGANTRDLLDAHEPRATELVATLGAIQPTERTMVAFAQALEVVVGATS